MSRRLTLLLVVLAASAGPQARATQAPDVTSPVEALGHNFGDDYFLANYQQIAAYWRTLDAESDRMTVESIGMTAEGREQLMAIVTSPANHANLARYKDISRRLALAEGVTDEEARALAREGKPVVWIDGGLHATETLGAQQLAEMVYRMVSRTDPETMRILDEVIILFVHANPDGNDLVADWYMRAPDPADRSIAQLPRLYQKYIGHDNNRDFFASTQAETENMNRVLYHEWFPQVLYNHHQSGPRGTILWSPPLRDPFNYNQHPLIPLGIQTLGLALHTRLAAEGKPGATMRNGGPYDGWWNGGIRNTAAFHNTIAILTEMIGSPTPTSVPLVMSRQLPSSDLTYPVPPQPWHFRQSIEYSVSCNLAVLDLAARQGETLLYNRYVMGRDAVEAGRRDSWTASPHRYAATAAAAAPDELWDALRAPDARDPRGYVLPSNQPDFVTATRFVNALRETGIRVHRATAPFEVAGRSYPAGSYVVKTDQAFRPHVLDMFEPQDHPDNIPYEGAAPLRPYDHAGWTLAFQMGVVFDRMLDGFDGPFEELTDWNVPLPAGEVAWRIGADRLDAPSYAVHPRQLDAFAAANRLLAAGEEVYRTPEGEFVVNVRPGTQALMETVARERGVTFSRPISAAGERLAPVRVGLWDRYGGSIDAGWARWILEQFEFPFERVFAPDLDGGRLYSRFDALVFVDGAIPSVPPPAAGGAAPGAGAGRVAGPGRRGAAGRAGGAGRGGGATGARGAGAPGIPAEYQGQLGSITAATMPQLREFVESGGTLIAIGSSATNAAAYFALPMSNHLERDGERLPESEHYVPGSILRAHVDTTHPVAYGMRTATDVFFDNAQVWRLGADARERGVRAIAWFDSAAPLRSGWAWGQHHLEGGVIAVEAEVGRGRLLLFGTDILKRAQPHATFRFLFNGIYRR